MKMKTPSWKMTTTATTMMTNVPPDPYTRLVFHAQYAHIFPQNSKPCFIQQHHRHFIFALLLKISEEETQQQQQITLYSFDRSGVVASQTFHIHISNGNTYEASILFVRIVLFVSSDSPSTVVIDPAWFYHGGVKHVHVKGPGGGIYKHLQGLNSKSQQSLDLFGRVPAWYLVEQVVERQNPPRRCIVKETWREEDQVPEYELLNTTKALGLKGIVNIVGFMVRPLTSGETPSSCSRLFWTSSIIWDAQLITEKLIIKPP